MSEHIVEIVNSIKNIRNKSYLELGTGNGINFSRINCKDKTSVDTNGKATINTTTDNFFSINNRRFDITFIDANHDLDFVVRDYNNAVKITNELIFIHDMFPATKMHINHVYCSDSYKLLYHILNTDIKFYVLDCDMGLTVIKPEFKSVNRSLIREVSYEELLSAKINRYSIEEMIKIVG
jgi:hypothetical protein